MKKYKSLVTIALAVLMAASVYALYSSTRSLRGEFDAHLASARNYAEKGVAAKALTEYKAALDIDADAGVALEVGNMFVSLGREDDAAEWGEYMLEKFPREPGTYTFMLRRYIEQKAYGECFDLSDMAEGRECADSEFRELMAGLEYAWELDYDSYEDVTVFSGGLCAVMDSGKWGYVSELGAKKVKRRFEAAGTFTAEGIAPVTLGGAAYFISADGEMALPAPVEDCRLLGPCVGGVFAVGAGGAYSYWTADVAAAESKKLLGDYEDAGSFNSGVAAVKTDGAWRLIDADGTVLTKESYEAAALDEKLIAFRNGRAFLYRDGAWRMVDENGAEIAGAEFEAVRPYGGSGSAAVKKNGAWGFVNADGAMTTEPVYEDARSFSNGFAAVRTQEGWGFISEDGAQVIPCEFEDARDFTASGTAFVKADGYWRLLVLYKYNH